MKKPAIPRLVLLLPSARRLLAAALPPPASSVSICMIFNLRLSILVLVLVLIGLYIITLAWNNALGWKSLLLEE